MHILSLFKKYSIMGKHITQWYKLGKIFEQTLPKEHPSGRASV
jgi:hypothetical protein